MEVVCASNKMLLRRYNQPIWMLLLIFALAVSSVHARDSSSLSSFNVNLSNNERAWIESNPQVYFTGDPNWLPYEAFLSDGSYIGIVADYLHLIERYTGLEFVAIPTSSWSESLQIATQGKVDVISGDAADAILNRQFKPIKAYSHNPVVIIMDSQQHYVEDLQQIKGKRIAIIKNYGYTADIFTTYPDFDFVEVENIQQGLNGVSDKHFDAMLATIALASYHMAGMGLSNVKVVGKTPIIMDLTLFVDKQQPILHSIIDQTLQALPRAATQHIMQNWVTRDYVEKSDYGLAGRIMLGILLLFAFSLWWVLRLRREVRYRKTAERSLRESEQRYDLAMAVSNDGIWDWDIANDQVLFDKRYYTMAGYRPYEFAPAFEQWQQRVHPQDIDAVLSDLQGYLDGSKSDYDVEFRFRQKQGDYMWIHARGRIVECDKDGSPLRVIGTHSDITQIKNYQSQLEHIAHFDALTGLPNRVLLTDRLNQAMFQSQRRNLKLAVVYLDLDGFKAINDSHDHQTGDRFLAAIAARMREALRKGDTLARLGGDEFIAVLGDLSRSEDSLPLIRRLLSAASMPIIIDEEPMQVSASIGITYYPQKRAVDAEQLLRQADQTMYQAKTQGKNCYRIFENELDFYDRELPEILENIEQALKRHQFRVYYQPQVNMRSGEVTGLEALIRWQHPHKGLLSPATFLPLAENTEVEVHLGDWVIESVLRQLTKWRAQQEFPPVSINISAGYLQQKDFVEKLKGFLRKYPALKYDDIRLEVFAPNALNQFQGIFDIIETCEDMGIRFALDEFGGEHASLTLLKQLPASTIKVNQGLVHNMLEDPQDLSLLEGIVSSADAFHRELVAKGVESVAQGELLLKMGCEQAQGFQICRPLPAERVKSWMQNWRPWQSWQQTTPYAAEDHSLLFASTDHRHWVRNLEHYLYWETEHCPEIDHHQCSFGKWLLKEGEQKYGDKRIFPSLQHLHEEIHQHASELIELHRQNENNQAKAGIEKLHGLRDRLLDYLDALGRE